VCYLCCDNIDLLYKFQDSLVRLPVQALQPSPAPASTTGSTVVKFVTASQAAATQKIVQATASNQPMTKLVVVCMANSGTTTSATQVSTVTQDDNYGF
jgi:16S rRNA G1207 methylase RsmC